MDTRDSTTTGSAGPTSSPVSNAGLGSKNGSGIGEAGVKALAESLLAIYKGRQSAYAVRLGNGGYATARRDGADLPLSLDVVQSHLQGGESIGTYFMEPGTDTCGFGLFDIDDHSGNAGWGQVQQAAIAIRNALTEAGLEFIAFRSGGGKGIHIVLPCQLPVGAADLRETMMRILHSARLKEGTGGAQKREIEIFPKQDRIEPGGYGNLVALPLARESKLLDRDFNVASEDPLSALQTLVPNDPKSFGSTTTRRAKARQQHAGTQQSGTPDSSDASAHPLSKCQFIQHCTEEAEQLSEPLWFAAACNLAPTEGGEEFFHELSALDSARYDKASAQAKFQHALESDAPHSCAKISELGFTCPKMTQDSLCSITGGRQPLSFAKTPKQIVADLRRVKPPVANRHRKIAAYVIKRLNVDGAFYVAKDDKSLYYFHNNEKHLYRLDSDEFKAFCSHLFGMNSTEPEYRFVLAEIETHAIRSGGRVDFFRFARYANENLYINAGRNRVFRLDGKKIEPVDNGTDGILFRDADEVEPIELPDSYEGSPVRHHLVKAINCHDPALLDLYEVYIYSLFFESILPTKPIVLITGEKGSGKSFAGRALKRALFGGESNVDTGLTADEKNAKAAFANNYLVCMDNVDGQISWMGNLLASVSTGTQIKERKLYVNNVEVSFTPRCFVMINSRDPISLKRDDVVDRLVIITVGRYDEFVPDARLLDQIHQQRGAIWLELLAKLNNIVLKLKKGVPLTIKDQRLADFANLGMLIGKTIGAKKVKQAFMNLDASRNALVLENHPILTALQKYIAYHPTIEWITTGDLFKALQLQDHNFPFKSPQNFGQQLRNLGTNLKGFIDIDFRHASHNVTEVRVGKLGESKQTDASTRSTKAAGTAGTTI